METRIALAKRMRVRDYMGFPPPTGVMHMHTIEVSVEEAMTLVKAIQGDSEIKQCLWGRKPTILSLNKHGYEILGMTPNLPRGLQYPIFNYLHEFEEMQVVLNPSQTVDFICLFEPEIEYKFAAYVEHFPDED